MKRSDFTLIELVVSIAILIVVAGIVGVSGVAFYQGYERTLRVTDRLKSCMAIDNLMDTHIRNMIPFNWQDEEGTSRLLFDGEENRILFATLRRSYGSRPGALLFIRVFVEDGKLLVEYSPYPRYPWMEDGDESLPATREVIAENVENITFSYVENSTEVSNGLDFFEEYREEDHQVLPLAIRLKVEFTDGTSEQWLRRVAGVSRNSTFGMREESGESGSSPQSSSAGVTAGSSRNGVRSGQGSGRRSSRSGISRVPGGGR